MPEEGQRLQVLRAQDYRRMPWKNGGGETTEIAVSPGDASLADFDWRVSMAHVAGDGPFSAFAGIDRTLCVLDGEGIDLDITDRDRVRLTTGGAPYGFPGDAATTGRLVNGPITDLNVMSRRGTIAHAVRVIALGEPATIDCDAGTVVVFVHGGRCALDCTAGQAELLALDCALLRPGRGELRLAGDVGARVFVVELFGVEVPLDAEN